jgi:hypothetical protein
MIEFKKMTQLERFDPPRPKGNPGPIVGDEYPSVMVDRHTIYVWFEFQVDNDYDLYLELVSELPDTDWSDGWGHWIEYEREMCGWDFLPGLVDHWPDELPFVKGALELGVAPNQPFLLRIEGHYSTSRDWETGYPETELEASWEFICAEPMSPDQALEEWRIWGRQVRHFDQEDREGGRAPWTTGPIGSLS